MPGFSDSVIRQGFAQSQVDPSLFTFHCVKRNLVILLYVDVIVLISDNQVVISQFVVLLAQEFEIKDLNPVYYFLGHLPVDFIYLKQSMLSMF